MWLKQSTAVIIPFGPFLDKGDGATLETGAGIITSIDHAVTGIMLSKNGGAFAVRNAAVTPSTYDAHGCFLVTLDTTDTNTLGRLRVIHTEPATYLAAWQDLMIVPANVWDSMFGADKLDVAIVEAGMEVDNDGTAISLTDAFKLILSVLTGKSSGGGSSTLVFRDIADTKTRISATVDGNGNRIAVGTRDAT